MQQVQGDSSQLVSTNKFAQWDDNASTTRPSDEMEAQNSESGHGKC
jgi:hypothetical protein